LYFCFQHIIIIIPKELIKVTLSQL